MSAFDPVTYRTRPERLILARDIRPEPEPAPRPGWEEYRHAVTHRLLCMINREKGILEFQHRGLKQVLFVDEIFTTEKR